MTVRSKRNSRSMTSLDIVSRAAAKHMRKVAANSPVTDVLSSNFSFSNGVAHNDSNNSNSQQTVVTGNRTQKPLQEQQQALSQQSQPQPMERVVAESPPVLISPAKASSNEKPKVSRALQINNPKQEQQQPGSAGSSNVGYSPCNVSF